MARARFGLFEFNSDTGELLREGYAVRLQAQPAKALALLISARGEVVTREAFRETLWNDGTSVEFDRSLNFAIAQVRTALGDSAQSPTFIRTVPKRGYQFIAQSRTSRFKGRLSRTPRLVRSGGRSARLASTGAVVACRNRRPERRRGRVRGPSGVARGCRPHSRGSFSERDRQLRSLTRSQTRSPTRWLRT